MLAKLLAVGSNVDLFETTAGSCDERDRQSVHEFVREKTPDRRCQLADLFNGLNPARRRAASWPRQAPEGLGALLRSDLRHDVLERAREIAADPRHPVDKVTPEP